MIDWNTKSCVNLISVVCLLWAVVVSVVARWCGGAVGQWLELRTLNGENPVSSPFAAISRLVQSTLQHFTQLYKLLAGYKQWWICE